MMKDDEIHEYFFRREHADGELLERFKGTSAQAIARARELAAARGFEVNMWGHHYGRGGSIRIFPTDLKR